MMMTDHGPLMLAGDSVEVLERCFPDASIDAMVTDPPAGISFMGKEWDRFGQQDYKARSDDPLKNTKGVMPHYGRGGTSQDRLKHSRRAKTSFIAAMTNIFSECLRVLKPGGHALVWALPRTSHWTAAALEDAGFEVRDVVTHLFGTGFPKSLDVSKAIDGHFFREWLSSNFDEAKKYNEQMRQAKGDAEATQHVKRKFFKAAGIERKVIGRRTDGAGNIGGEAVPFMPPGSKDYDLTAPATDDARRWKGFGTSLKPASEHWILARKQLIGTVAANVLEHGTGALNIDGCRVVHAEPEKHTTRTAGKFAGVTYAKDKYSINMDGGSLATPKASGRWPANLLLTHAAACEPVGTRKVRGANTPGPGKRGIGFAGEGAGADGIQRYMDEDGLEEVESWHCSPGCPVAALDEQSGDRGVSSGGGMNRDGQGENTVYAKQQGHRKVKTVGFGDSGGASRFFPTFRYQAKASTKERSEGLPEGEKNRHPTVKSVELMRWLCRLVTSPGGVVLDPFMGSGSTGVACAQEGFRFVGIEKSEEYIEIAAARIKRAIADVEDAEKEEIIR